MSDSELSEFVLPFGKYVDATLEEVYLADKRYLKWAADNWDNDVGDKIREFLEEK